MDVVSTGDVVVLNYIRYKVAKGAGHPCQSDIDRILQMIEDDDAPARKVEVPQRVGYLQGLLMELTVAQIGAGGGIDNPGIGIAQECGIEAQEAHAAKIFSISSSMSLSSAACSVRN